ncbi:MAG: diguanylate cyclase [Agathobacter sp.]|nr:diguanylate cyclase [Agathobacter sp.]
MGILINFSLILCGVIAITAGVSYYTREKEDRLLRQSMLILSIATFLWCCGYSFMGFSEPGLSAFIGRIIGLSGVLIFLVTEVSLAIYLSGTFEKYRKWIVAFNILLAAIDLILFSQPNVLEFTVVDNRTCYYALESPGRLYHGLYLFYMILSLLVLGIPWLLKCRLKRDRQFVSCLFIANILIVLFALPDTILPIINIPSFPSSGYGGFLAFMIIWTFGTTYNAFRISVKNLSSYIYNYVSSSILIFNDEYKLELANDFAKNFFHIEAGSQPELSDLFEISREDAIYLFESISKSKDSADCKLISTESTVLCSLKFTEIIDRFGDPYCYVCFVYDLSEEAAMLKQVNQMKSGLEKELRKKTKQVEQLTLQSITTIANSIDEKDSYTKGHSIRVAEYSAKIASKLGWSDSDIQNLRYMALLHDIGRIAISDALLNKPGKLSQVEYDQVKTHTLIGGDILKDITVVKDLDAGALFHHERYDGTGYPKGLKGEEIPFAARIISIADAYDAMNSHRIYRSALSPEEIRKELVEGRGTQFDPDLLDIFLELLDNNQLAVDTEKYGKTNSIADESSRLLSHIMTNMEEEWKKESETDYLTGLLNRKTGETKIVELMKAQKGCLAIVDLDNLKTINDRYGHIAGDCALQAVAEVLDAHAHNAISARIGGDEFLYYMDNVNEKEASKIIESLIHSFRRRKSKHPEIEPASLSIGLAISQPMESYADIYQKADKALYYIKQNGKDGYAFYHTPSKTESSEKQVDLKRIADALMKQGTYQGTLDLEYREFTKLYNFVKNMGTRYDYNLQLLMITVEPVGNDTHFTDKKEEYMAYVDTAIKGALRNVDISTRYSSDQFLVILSHTKSENMHIITDRILDQLHNLYTGNSITLNYDVIDLLDLKNN